MVYPINKSDGSLAVNVLDSTIDNSFNLSLVGRGVVNYGDATAENFFHLMENFAADLEPGVNTNLQGLPTRGQLWYDTTNKILKVYDPTVLPNWRPLSFQGSSTFGPTFPAGPIAGQVFYLTTAPIGLYYWNGTSWIPLLDTSTPQSLSFLDGRYVIKSGDTMTGPLVIAAGGLFSNSGLTVSGSSTLSGAVTLTDSDLIIGPSGGNIIVNSQGAVQVSNGPTSTRPVSGTVANGMIRYNTDTAKLEAYENNTWLNIVTGAIGSSVTSVNTGVGLTGGPITSTGTINFAPASITVKTPPTLADNVVISDASDSGNPKLVSLSDIQTLVNPAAPSYSYIGGSIAVLKWIGTPTGGEGFTTVTGWNRRALNWKDDADGIVLSLAGSQFTLKPGYYMLDANLPVYSSHSTVIGALVNNTTGAYAMTSANSGSTFGDHDVNASYASSASTLNGIFQVTDQTHLWSFNQLIYGGKNNGFFASNLSYSGSSSVGIRTILPSIINGTTGVITDPGHMLVNGSTIKMTSTGTLPTGISASTYYYAVNVVLGSSYQLSASPMGTPLTYASTGTGTLSVSNWIPTIGVTATLRKLS